MIYVYVTLITVFFAVLLWAFVSFHYVLTQQRRLNGLWGQLSGLLAQRDTWLGELPGLWETPGQEAQALQDLLERDMAMHWQDVPARAALRKDIEAQVYRVLALARKDARTAQDPKLAQVEQALRDNGAILAKCAKDYNRSVQVYNNLLTVNPNRFMARKVGLEPAPQYVAE